MLVPGIADPAGEAPGKEPEAANDGEAPIGAPMPPLFFALLFSIICY